jgi:branched-chain amino acid transport system substrate-binding protein
VKRIVLFLLLLVAIFALAACERKPSAVPPASPSPEPSTPVDQATPAPPAPTPTISLEQTPTPTAAQTPAAETPSPPAAETPTPPPDESPSPTAPEVPTPSPAEAAVQPAEETPKPTQPVDDPLATRVGFLAPLTGAHASLGTEAMNGATLALEEINLAGGVLDHPLKLIIKDTESLPEKTGGVVNDLINTDKVAALIGEIATDRSLIAAALAQPAGIPMITPSATNEKVTATGDHIFRVCFTDAFQAAVMAKFARSLEVEKAAILFDASSASSTALMEAFKADVLQHDGTILAEEFYRVGDTDFAYQLNSIRDKIPDIIFLPGYFTEAAPIIRQARQLGIDAPFLGTDGWESTEFLKMAGQAANNCYFATHFSNEQSSEKVKAFSDAYYGRFGSTPSSVAALTYDSVWLLAEALKHAGSADPAAIRNAISEIRDFPGVTGIISFDKGADPKKPGIVIRVQDGKFSYLETIEL